ncbi:riboflavin synthase [Brevibacterium sp. UMB1308A]|uniref:riboflavin synthase n=1 Tax=Brevibacterium sp. UMB1308A TaxID=3050608 RepID=UPI002551A44A|nr:riboflavin synthase [Brevibacterium sp. UMB1308A]MDK8346843.1 riboflavin synthase [Brevibacterium sp. UMB1308B]MDK8713991.1 riboflavin synthase [Brevibacterium sp. UMB1308A]
MFTGIVQKVVPVHAVERRDGFARIVLDTGELTADLPPGGSLAVNGVCLTETESPASAGRFTAHVMEETLRLTNLGALGAGSFVNVERSLAVTDRLDGHIVQGHVDAVGEVLAVTELAGSRIVRVSVPEHLAPLMAVKGSVALNGVSLTITAVSDANPQAGTAPTHWVEVSLIPATCENTTFGTTRVGDLVNIEADVVARYTARLNQFATTKENS